MMHAIEWSLATSWSSRFTSSWSSRLGQRGCLAVGVSSVPVVSQDMLVGPFVRGELHWPNNVLIRKACK